MNIKVLIESLKIFANAVSPDTPQFFNVEMDVIRTMCRYEDIRPASADGKKLEESGWFLDEVEGCWSVIPAEKTGLDNIVEPPQTYSI